MKKLLSLLLVAVFMLSMVACGGSNGGSGVGIGGADTPEEAIEIYLNAMANLDADDYCKVTLTLNADVIVANSTLGDKDKAEIKGIIEAAVKEMRESAKDAPKTENFNIISIKENDDKMSGDVEEVLEDGGLMKNLEAYASYDCQFEGEYDGEKQNVEREIDCVKFGGKWYVVG